VLASIFGSGLPTYVQGIILAVVLFIVFVGLLLVWRSVRSGAGRATSQGASRARQPRLGVVDVFDLDRQRQLILLRRDNVEHLVMIGGPNDVVVEQQIMRGAAARTTPSVEAILEKALQADDNPEPHPVAEARPVEPRQEPRQPPKQPARSAAAPGPAPQRNAPRPGDETVLNDMTRQLEEALKKPFAPAQEGEPPQLPQRRDPVLQAPPVQVAKSPANSPANNPGNYPGNVDFSQGPARAAVPPPRQPAQAPDRAPPQPAMVRAMPPPPRPELVKEPPKEPPREAAKEPPKESPREPPKPPMAEAKPEGNGQVPKQGALPKVESINAEMAKPQQPVREPVKVEPPYPPQVPPSVVPAEQKDLDPFSPEAIEAEFARLLGRLPSKSSG
jgi:flagellar protein FliO/FliZ